MSTKQKRAALYLRVSTTKGQTTANQRRALIQAAKLHGWKVAAIFDDAGISGAKGRDQRPGLAAMMTGVARREFDIVAAWSVDRLGRSLHHLIDLLGDLHAKGVDLYLHQQGLDTSTPTGKAMFQMVGVFAEFERATIGERILAGLDRARAEGKQLGRPTVAPDVERNIRTALKAGKGIVSTARRLGVGVSTVQRVKAELAFA
jgi:DNA invertase Pin-like site-specific DNA recombinase